MKKAIFAILNVALLASCNQPDTCKQPDDYRFFLDSAKTLFKSEVNLTQEEYEKFDFFEVVSLLEQAIELNPESAEARYFLGYTYSRINARDGENIVSMRIDLLLKASEQFEKVIELTPKYEGETAVLHPYSKLTSEWGSMAMNYLHKNRADSAVWAFKQGKKRGGFGGFFLELNKRVLDACGENAILVSSGDNFTLPLWYLQVVEKYRTDVSVVDVNLLNSKWYPVFLSKNNYVAFDVPVEVLEDTGHIKWSDTTITINNFSWTVKPSYYDQVLLRGDRIFLSLLKENKFQREMCFTIGFNEDSRLSLNDHITPQVFIDKLSVFQKTDLAYEDYKNTILKAFSLLEHINTNNPDELGAFDLFRHDLLERVMVYLSCDEKEKSEELMNMLDTLVDEKKYPFQSETLKKFADHLRTGL